jgi:hypothetical protein
MQNDRELRFAVLIDADNVSHAHVKPMLEEIARYGVPTNKRIYGDWTKPQLGGWKNVLLDNAITPVQQYGYTSGKNSTDSAMIIDAMDLLYSKNVDGFCLVSSDSDFTRLAIRLRESGMKVIGIGEKKTPSAFIAACEKFIYLEVISPSARMLETSSAASASPAAVPAPGPQTAKPRGRGRGPVVRLPLGKAPVAPAVPPVTAVPAASVPVVAASPTAATQSVPNSPALVDDRVRRDIVQLVSTAVNAVSDDNGWAFLGDIGTLIAKSRPDFDPRNYGFGKLALLVAALGRFDIEYRESGQPNVKRVYIRNKG